MHEWMIMFLTLLFFSFFSLSYTRGPFSRSFSISHLFFRDLFQSPNFLYTHNRMATSELRSWSLISTHISFSFYATCMMFTIVATQHIYNIIPFLHHLMWFFIFKSCHLKWLSSFNISTRTYTIISSYFHIHNKL